MKKCKDVWSKRQSPENKPLKTKCSIGSSNRMKGLRPRSSSIGKKLRTDTMRGSERSVIVFRETLKNSEVDFNSRRLKSELMTCR